MARIVLPKSRYYLGFSKIFNRNQVVWDQSMWTHNWSQAYVSATFRRAIVVLRGRQLTIDPDQMWLINRFLISRKRASFLERISGYFRSTWHEPLGPQIFRFWQKFSHEVSRLTNLFTWSSLWPSVRWRVNRVYSSCRVNKSCIVKVKALPSIHSFLCSWCGITTVCWESPMYRIRLVQLDVPNDEWASTCICCVRRRQNALLDRITG